MLMLRMSSHLKKLLSCPYCQHLNSTYPTFLLHRPKYYGFTSRSSTFADVLLKDDLKKKKQKQKWKQKYTDVITGGTEGELKSQQKKLKKMPADKFLQNLIIDNKSLKRGSFSKDVGKLLEEVKAILQQLYHKIDDINNNEMLNSTQLQTFLFDISTCMSKAISNLLSVQYILDHNNLVQSTNIENVLNIATQVKYNNILLIPEADELVSDSSALLKTVQELRIQLQDLDIENSKLAFSCETEERLQDSNSTEQLMCSDVDQISQSGIPLDNEESISVSVDEPISSTVNKKTKISKKVRETTAKVKLQLLDSSGKEFSLKNSLGAYLQVCVETGNIEKACHTLRYYRRKGVNTTTVPKARSFKLDNIILRYYAGIGDIEQLKSWLRNEEEKVTYDIYTYAAIFECVGRQKHPDVEYIESVHQNIIQNGFGLDDLFCKVKVENEDGREYILKAAHMIDPSFTPSKNCVPLGYTCSLLQNIDNTPLQGWSSGSDLMSAEDLLSNMEEQFQLEADGEFTVSSIVREEHVTPEVIKFRENLSYLEKNWKWQLEESFIRRVNNMKSRDEYMSRSPYTGLRLLPYLQVLPVNQYVQVMLKEIQVLAHGSDNFSPSIKQLKKGIGFKILQRYRLQQKEKNGVVKKLKRVYKKYSTQYLHDNQMRLPRERWIQLTQADMDGPSLDLRERVWPSPVLLSLGNFLYDILLKDITVEPFEKISNLCSAPVLFSIYRHHGPVIREEIKIHPEVMKLYRNAMLGTLTFPAVVAPMIVPPLPWISQHTGGYLLHHVNVVRFLPGAVQQRAELGKASSQQLYPMLDSLNQLSAVPWKVNKPLLDVVTEVFRSGGNADLDIPLPPEPVRTDEPQRGKTEEERRKIMQHRKQQAEIYSLWCDMLYKLSIANHYRNRVVWFPHNMDFRGRVYPCPPHFSHMGSDVSRSLLKFAQGKPLGEKGLNWLKIHLVNLTGKKKRNSLEERLRYANDILPEILDSADHPLTGERWWSESDEPWQTLAVCMEIAAAIRSEDPAAYISTLPVHQDGSCNGLQHYAALGRDVAGAESVNLVPHDVPQDVYTTVATLVERERAKDAEEGLQIAKVLEGFVERKVIKQTVMTTVYGVTRYGGRLQIARQLKDLKNFPQSAVFPASSYLVGKVFLCLREMFSSAREIQDWLTSCAQLISQVCAQNVEWITPLGLPVVQPYMRPPKYANANTSATGFLYPYFQSDQWSRPNTQKQKNAFPPNLIHSLDSNHMMLTSIFCQRLGVEFVSVHDCFWTHASTVDLMNKVCRDQFVSLHSEPILEDLSDYLVKKFGYDESCFPIKKSAASDNKHRLNQVLKQVPSKGNFNLEEVLNSVYFFS